MSSRHKFSTEFWLRAFLHFSHRLTVPAKKWTVHDSSLGLGFVYGIYDHDEMDFCLFYSLHCIAWVRTLSYCSQVD